MKTLLAFAAVLVLAACGTETSPEEAAPAAPVERPEAVPAADSEVTTTFPVTVLDDGDGPELCLGAIAASLPPQCAGPSLVGWDWTEHDGAYEEVHGVRWGEFVVTGTFDGRSFTPTEVTPGDQWTGEYDDAGRDFTTPCDEPEGGWVVDPSLVGHGDQDSAFRVADQLPDYSTSFIDTSADGRTPEEMDQDAVAGDLDASRWIVNVRVTGDPAVAEGAIREVWGGGLCVLGAGSTDAERARIQREVNELPGMVMSSRGVDHVELTVVHDDGSIQTWADQEYGEGAVVVTSALVPVA